jgi:glycosyltransferase involved in cell wall biosynthesis
VERPLVSVVIAAYQAEKFLAEAIESVLVQTYSPIELIVADDGSTDQTAAIAARYADVEVLSLPHRGQSAARNSGLAAARGKLITFHDADDVMLPERIEVQFEHLESHDDIDVVVCAQELKVEEGAEMPFWHQENEDSMLIRAGRRERGNVHTMTPLAHREIFDRIGGFDEAMPTGEDVDWLFRVKEAGIGIGILDRPLVIRRVHPDSLTQRPDWERLGLFEIFHARIKRKRAAQ